ncbi:MAG: dethiobiotin synthase [Deltaproteobacteria bacterium]|nr:MAG: dethiobiotin synthase [Deltaproteobacteria bacterium]
MQRKQVESSNKKIQNLFVVGTDTGVGKTVLALLMMQFFFTKGYNPFYLKPVQTGCKDANDADSDAQFIYWHVEPLRGKQPAESVIYCFKNPKAPLYAASDEGKSIDLSKIEKVVSQKAEAHSPVILEGAGGVLVPVTGKKLMVDIISLVNGTPVIAARAGLGTINHTLLTIEAIEKRGLKPLGIVFIDAGEKETPAEMIRENKSAIEEISGIKVAGVVGRIHDFSRPPHDCYKPLAKMFG